MNEPIPSKVCEHDNTDRKSGSNLRKLGYTRLCEDRPAQSWQLERVGYVGGQTLKVRRPDIGEIGLSELEINHAVQYGITM